MKIVRVEQDRVKVILSESDLIDMNIDIENLVPNSPELSAFLRIVIDAVKKETGFSIENGQVTVEATTYCGGIVLVLSKVRIKDKGRIKGVKVAGKKENIVFEFCSFDDLAKMLVNSEKRYILSMHLYEYDGSFYVSIPRHSIPFLIYEFSLNNKKSAVSESFLAEYGKFLADGKSLSTIAVGLKKII
ncbi:MAG: adaptor protein MecA [Clostridia bacterium]|nr:adaptor protein MecA [Clostridia bacterium]